MIIAQEMLLTRFTPAIYSCEVGALAAAGRMVAAGAEYEVVFSGVDSPAFRQAILGLMRFSQDGGDAEIVFPGG